MTSIETILGIIIRDHQATWHDAKQAGFSKEIFYDARHVTIAEAIESLSAANITVDLVTVCDKVGASLTGMVIDLVTNAPVTINFEHLISQAAGWSRLKSMALDLTRLANEIIRGKTTEPFDGVILEIKELSERADAIQARETSGIQLTTAIESTIARVEQRIEDSMSGVRRGYKTGVASLDQSLSGLIGGRLYVVAARTSVGKTTFAAHMALHVMRQGGKPIFFTNEMDPEDLVEKWIAAEGKVNGQAMQTGDFKFDQLDRFQDGVKSLFKMNCVLDSKSGWSLDQLTAAIHRRVRRGNCDAVFVDYLQQVRVPRATTRQEQVSAASDAMKKISRDLNIPVICLAQINRESEKNGKPTMPTLANLKDSGSIEQDADVVMILHKGDISVPAMELFIAKNRYGRTGMINLKHIQSISSYEEIND
jgi:replicative DNA helicase